MNTFKESELVLNSEGGVYHLKAKAEQIADDIIVVGDPQRVEIISSYFDNIEHKISNREINTHTGTYKGKRISVISTGMGPDNIDIVINELDAAVNFDLTSRTIKDKKRKLNIIRVGTSGAMQKNIPVDSFVMSTHGLGIDGVLNFYNADESVFDNKLTEAFIKQTNWPNELAKPYTAKCSDELAAKFDDDVLKGITVTAPGFYGPQGRTLRIPLKYKNLNKSISNFNYNGQRVATFEMETSALYGIGGALGHNMLTICVIIANRMAKVFSKDYKASTGLLIKYVLDRI